MNFCRQSARFTAFAIALLACLPLCRAGTAPSEAWRVAVVGFERPAGIFVAPIAGARSTELAAARMGNKGELLFMKQAEFAGLGVGWPTFQSKASPAASALLEKVKTEWIRDRHQVIECAILRGAHPSDDITPVILAPGFLERFTPVFGRKVLIAIPERGTIFLFPRLASRYQDYAERVLAVYRKTKSPVSRELLELSAAKLRAIGEYE